MRIWFLDTGSIVIDHAQLMWNIGGGTPVRIPAYGVLIEHPEGLFLVDTGFGLEHTNRVLPFELPEQTPEQTIPEQLRLCGFEPSDVTTLLMSHLHFDHVGGTRFLTDA
ncbi:MAG: MBL fold metallo-hydrolase, partial [Gaiellales bacterium]